MSHRHRTLFSRISICYALVAAALIALPALVAASGLEEAGAASPRQGDASVDKVDSPRSSEARRLTDRLEAGTLRRALLPRSSADLASAPAWLTRRSDALRSKGMRSNATPTVPPDLTTELRLDSARRANMRRLVGENRWRQMREARFQLDRLEADPTTSLHDLPEVYNKVRRTLEKCAIKAASEVIERKIGLHGVRDAHDRRRDVKQQQRSQGFGFSYSPRIGLGSDPALGVRLRMRTDDPFWSRLSVEVKQRFESDELGLRLMWRSQRHQIELSHTLNDRYSLRTHDRKDSVTSLSVRLSF